jgi:hypothetical protein
VCGQSDAHTIRSGFAATSSLPNEITSSYPDGIFAGSPFCADN